VGKLIAEKNMYVLYKHTLVRSLNEIGPVKLAARTKTAPHVARCLDEIVAAQKPVVSPCES
jgi:hypothetical protein